MKSNLIYLLFLPLLFLGACVINSGGKESVELPMTVPGTYYDQDNPEFIKISLYTDDSFLLEFSTCDDIGMITGMFEVESSKRVAFTYGEESSNEFSGFAGEDQRSFLMEVLSPTTLKYHGELLGCGPYEEAVFELGR